MKVVSELIKDMCTHSDNACVMDIRVYFIILFTVFEVKLMSSELSGLSTNDGRGGGIIVICVLNMFASLLKQCFHAVAHDIGRRGEAFARICFLKLHGLSAIVGLLSTTHHVYTHVQLKQNTHLYSFKSEA